MRFFCPILVLLTGTAALSLTATAAIDPTKKRYIAPQAFHFFYVNKPLAEAKAPWTVAMIHPEERQPDYRKLYVEAQKGKHRPARAGLASLVIGRLPGGRHPSKYGYRMVEARLMGKKLDCQLHFTYYIIPGTGPGIPLTPYFAVKLPALSAGEHTIRFKVVKSFLDPGTGLLTQEHEQRDALAREAYEAKFVIKK